MSGAFRAFGTFGGGRDREWQSTSGIGADIGDRADTGDRGRNRESSRLGIGIGTSGLPRTQSSELETNGRTCVVSVVMILGAMSNTASVV